MMLQEKQFNVERINITLEEKYVYLFQAVFILSSIKMSVPYLARPSIPEKHGLIIALFQILHCNNCLVFPFCHFGIFFLFFSQFFGFFFVFFHTFSHLSTVILIAYMLTSTLFLVHLCQ